MENDKDNIFEIDPVKNYEAPKLPTLQGVRDNPGALKKLPSRWRKSAAVVGCVGLLAASTVTLSSCIFLHHGGAGGAPSYVVYLTEQEAFGIIREGLEEAGLSFDAAPPNYTVNVRGREIGIDLFDEEKGVAVAFSSEGLLSRSAVGFVEQAEEEFSQRTHDMSIGVFYNPMFESWDHWIGMDAVRDNLTSQVQEFINFLRREGIL